MEGEGRRGIERRRRKGEKKCREVRRREEKGRKDEEEEIKRERRRRRGAYLENANLLVCADCVPFAYANFHADFLKDHVVVVGCPKLDDINHYANKIGEMIYYNNIKSVKVLKMEVPCCTGIATVTRNAVLASEKDIAYQELTITIDGKIRG